MPNNPESEIRIVVDAMGGDFAPHNVVAGALQSNTIGSNNSAFGTGALGSNTTGSNNTAVGYQAAYSNTGQVVDEIGRAHV